MNTPFPLDMPRALRDAGCNDEMCERLPSLKGESKEQACLLKRQRRLLLNDLHHTQREIDCLDYILQELERQEGGKS